MNRYLRAHRDSVLHRQRFGRSVSTTCVRCGVERTDRCVLFLHVLQRRDGHGADDVCQLPGSGDHGVSGEFPLPHGEAQGR